PWRRCYRPNGYRAPGLVGRRALYYLLATTISLSLASRRTCVVAITLTMFAGVPCRGLTPDRIPDFTAALSGAGGVISATTLIILLIRARRSFLKSYPSVWRIRSMIFELAPRLIRGDLRGAARLEGGLGHSQRRIA